MKVLVVIDMQNDFVTGSLGSKDAEAIVPNAVAKVKQHIDNGDYIFYTMDTHYDRFYLETEEGKNLPIKHCITNTEGWKIIPELQELVNKGRSIIIEKESFSDPRVGENMFRRVEEDTTIEIIGLCTDICVVSNALLIKSFCPEAHIVVDSSCCAGTSRENHEAALQTMRSCQIEIR